MAQPLSKWRVSLYLDECCQIEVATVEMNDVKGRREVVRMITGPFDDPETILATIIELIDHAEWRGEQLRLPVPADEQ